MKPQISESINKIFTEQRFEDYETILRDNVVKDLLGPLFAKADKDLVKEMTEISKDYDKIKSIEKKYSLDSLQKCIVFGYTAFYSKGAHQRSTCFIKLSFDKPTIVNDKVKGFQDE